MASAFLSRTHRCVSSFANQNSQKLSSFLFKTPIQSWASSTLTAHIRFTLVRSDIASTVGGSRSFFSTQSKSTGEPVVSVDCLHANLSERDLKGGDSANGGGDFVCKNEGQTEASTVTQELTVNVESPLAKLGVQVSLEADVDFFKSVLEKKFDIPAGKQCLICQGNILEDDRTLKSYGLAAGHKVYLVVMGDGPLKIQAPDDLTTALASPASYFQGLYDSDPDFREVVNYPNLFREFC